MLAAVRGPRKTITFANFVYEQGKIARTIAAAMAERCRAGVKVNVLLDPLGSNRMAEAHRAILQDAGCHLDFYGPLQPLRSVGPIIAITVASSSSMVAWGSRLASASVSRGRAMDASHGAGAGPIFGWKGPVVRALRAAFAETWREATGLLLGGDEYFPPLLRRRRLTLEAVPSPPASRATEDTYCSCSRSIMRARRSR